MKMNWVNFSLLLSFHLEVKIKDDDVFFFAFLVCIFFIKHNLFEHHKLFHSNKIVVISEMEPVPADRQ